MTNDTTAKRKKGFVWLDL